MASDIPEHYQGHPAFQFIKEVGLDWDDTKVLNGEIGKYITIARKEKGTENWFLGSLTNRNPRELEVPLSFLSPGVTYQATIYADAEDTHFEENPESYQIIQQEVNEQTVLKIKLAPGGGQAISFRPN